MIGRQISRFYIIRSLGSGGMGVVYEAQDTRLPRSVAIKLLRPALAKRQDAVRRFRREARLASRLNHPNICTILDVGEGDGEVFIAMELLQGESLKQRLNGTPAGLSEIVDVGLQMARALAAAHAQGIMHRDIKPGNVFVCTGGLIKLLDFGLAKQFAVEEMNPEFATDVGFAPRRILGTLHYMAPEQLLNDQPLDGRCDLYALGAVLYQMASGSRPFDAATREEVIELILDRPHVPLRQLAPEQPIELERLIDALLSKRAADRPTTAGVISALEQMRTTPAPAPTRASAPPTSIAVLSFRASGPETGDGVGDGFADDLAAQLSRNPGVRVVSRTSTIRAGSHSIRHIGRTLNATLIVEGSVQCAGGDTRVIANIVNASDEQLVTPAISISRRGERPLDVQSDVAKELALKIATTVRPVNGGTATPNRDALIAFKRGQQHWLERSNGGWEPAIVAFQEAVQRQPDFALGYLALASAYEFAGFYTLMKPGTAFQVAEDYINKALKIDDTMAGAHTELALIRFGGHWDWEGSEHSFRRALELDPENAIAHVCYSWLLMLLGREDAAFAEAATGERLAPESRFVRSGRAQTLYLARRYEEVIAICNQCLAESADYVFALALRGQCYELLGLFPLAVSDLERSATLTRRMPFYVGMLGHCYGVAGMHDEATAVLEELTLQEKIRYVPPQCYVYVHAGLGDRVTALQYQEAAYSDGASPFNYFAPSIRDLYALDPLHKRRLEQLRLIL